ncbi:MAG: hypothetical protein A2Y10_09010 [Planctomycetes bacterium GWF2_41_51]|nr:MAG: hypothetical protein A2Y10_09010 [Planctomycetes bacterium GWF2_41_51]HBG26261.1 hypothetical protein [Phycisphaerales bacterium]
MKHRILSAIIFVFCILPQTAFSKDLSTKSFLDAVTGRRIHAVGLAGTNTAHLYPTSLTWDAASTKLIVNANIQLDKWGWYCDFVEFDTVSEKTTYIDSYRSYYGAVSRDNKFYYIKKDKVYYCDLKTYQKELVCAHPNGFDFYGVPTISNDNTVMAVYWKNKNDNLRNIGKIDLKTGKLSVLVSSADFKDVFSPPYPDLNHPLVNPVYKNLIFFCLDGPFGVNRMWIYDENLDKIKSHYEPKQLGGKVGEYLYHENWAADGEKIYVIKSHRSPVKPAGIMWVDKWDSTKYGIVNSDYQYHYASPSSDGKWLIACTRYIKGLVDKQSDIVLVDLMTKKTMLLARVDTVSDGHVHPSFSLDNKKVTFTFIDSDKKMWVGYIDITQKPDLIKK